MSVPPRLIGLGLLLSLARLVISADGAVWTEAQDELPPWAKDNTLQLKLSADSTNYAVIPLTKEFAFGSSNSRGGAVDLDGNLRDVHERNYDKFDNNDDVAYISCDDPDDDTDVDANTMLNEVMKQTPRAIVLFSTSKNWCSIDSDDDLDYSRFLSMVDPGEAASVLNHLNGTDKGEVVDVSIYGDTTNLGPIDGENDRGQHQSSVAMAVLYSITGLITFLFLIIIMTGAVRAQRYPERYGPRLGVDGGPRQSRAKGLAKAVLETLPIVKFGDRNQPKPDPDLEMDTATTDGQYPTARAVPHAEEAQSNRVSRQSMSASEATGTSIMESDVGDEQLGCSICTDDFKVGEDVRVLPCNHQYHPNCVDPWLINISGTCPLCRLDLRPGHDRSRDESTAGGERSLPPPLAWEMSDNGAEHNTYQSRLSRLFDANRLRQASVEEQMQALRQLREDGRVREGGEDPQPGAAAPAEGEDRHQGARFADKLKERFRILTKSQSAHRQTC